MSLKTAIENRIRQEVLQPMSDLGDWKVLVLDAHATKIIDACFKMVDLAQFKITLVEDINKAREPVPLSAVYLIAPDERSIERLQDDFKSNDHRYQAAHVFFTKNCSEQLLHNISRSYCFAYLRTLKEVDLDFIMVEPHVFHLDARREARMYWQKMMMVVRRDYYLKRTAERLVTVCSALGVNPQIRYMSKSPETKVFGTLVQTALDNLVRRDPKSITAESGAERSILLILDRSFDPISPILHELTFQAMVYDVLDVDQDDIYRFGSKSAVEGKSEHEFSLKEGNKIWDNMKYMHIANVTKDVLPNMLKEFKQRRHIREPTAGSGGTFEENSGDSSSQSSASSASAQTTKTKLRELNQVVKRMPQYKREMDTYTSLFAMAEECMAKFGPAMRCLCEVEQDYVMQKTKDGDDLKDMFARFNEALRFDLSNADKLRLLMLFVIVKGGLTAETPQKLIEYATLSGQSMDILNSLTYLQVPVIVNEVKKSLSTAPYMAPQRSSCAEVEGTFSLSRWKPYLQDILQAIHANTLSLTEFPLLEASGGVSLSTLSGGAAHFSLRPPGSGQHNPGLSLEDEMRSTQLDVPSARGQSQQQQLSPFSRRRQFRSKLIVFVLGGVTLSETRCAMNSNRDNDTGGAGGAAGSAGAVSRNGTFNGQRAREVVLGGTHILTPKRFLEDLQDLSKSYDREDDDQLL